MHRRVVPAPGQSPQSNAGVPLQSSSAGGNSGSCSITVRVSGITHSCVSSSTAAVPGDRHLGLEQAVAPLELEVLLDRESERLLHCILLSMTLGCRRAP